jgi:hypothetical protein
MSRPARPYSSTKHSANAAWLVGRPKREGGRTLAETVLIVDIEVFRNAYAFVDHDRNVADIVGALSWNTRSCASTSWVTSTTTSTPSRTASSSSTSRSCAASPAGT